MPGIPDTGHAPAADWYLRCAGLSVRRGGRLVLERVDLTLRPAECVSVVGPNGSGKTTLMQALLGLLPPTSGTVQLNDTDIHRVPARARGRFAAYVPQGLGPSPAFTVHEVVAGGRFPHVSELRPLSAADHAAVLAALEWCGLSDLADRPFNALSGGERQKTLIAAAIAQEPQVLFLDEPNTALDPAYQVELVQILARWRKLGRSVFVISHDLQLPAALAGRVVALRDGRIVADGPTAEVLTPERLGAIYAAPFEAATTAGGHRIVLPAWWRGA